jgi:ParB/RepB/Spo0J family partition protein
MTNQTSETESTVELKEIPIEEIEIPEEQKFRIPEAQDFRLVESLKKFGQVNPIVVSPASNGKYRVVYGERRVWAAHKAGLKTLKCIIVHLPEEDIIKLRILDASQSRSHNIDELAKVVNYLHSKGMSDEEIGSILGLHRSTIVKIRSIQNIPFEIAVYGDRIGPRTLQEFMRIQDKKARLHAVMIAHWYRFNREKIRQLISYILKGHPPELAFELINTPNELGRCLECPHISPKLVDNTYIEYLTLHQMKAYLKYFLRNTPSLSISSVKQKLKEEAKLEFSDDLFNEALKSLQYSDIIRIENGEIKRGSYFSQTPVSFEELQKLDKVPLSAWMSHL